MRRKILTGPWTGIPLQQARIAAGLSQSELARRVAREPGCGRVSPSTVQANEPGPRGGKAPNATLLGAYARALGVTTDALLSSDDLVIDPIAVRIPDPPRCPECDALILPVRGSPTAGRCQCRTWRAEQRETGDSRPGCRDYALWWVAGIAERDPDPTIEVSRESLGLPRRDVAP